MIAPIDQQTYERLNSKDLREWLSEVCQPTTEGVYYRPLVADGRPQIPPVVVLGQNPVTVIRQGDHPAVANVEMYVDLLLRRGDLEDVLEEVAGELSETRQRLNIIHEELTEELGGYPVVEANICAFPAAGDDFHGPENAEWVKHGKLISRELLCLLRPTVLFAHGNDCFDGLERLFRLRRGQLRLPPEPLITGWRDPEKVRAPWGTVSIFRYPHLKARYGGLNQKRIRDDLIKVAPAIEQHLR